MENLKAIAHECAEFAADNYDALDTDGLNCTLTPESIWQGWHSKEEIDAPDMPAGFAQEYWYQCERVGGADFSGDIQRLSRLAVMERA